MVDETKPPKPTVYNRAKLELRRASAEVRRLAPIKDNGTIFPPTAHEVELARAGDKREEEAERLVSRERARWELAKANWNATHEESLWVK